MNEQNRIKRDQRRALNLVKEVIDNDDTIVICTKKSIVMNGSSLDLVAFIGDITRQLVETTEGEYNSIIREVLKDLLKDIKEG